MQKLAILGFLNVCSALSLYAAEESQDNFPEEIEQILLHSGTDAFDKKLVDSSFVPTVLLNESRQQVFNTYLQRQVMSAFPQVLRNPSHQSFLDEDKQILFSTFLQNDETPPYLHLFKESSFKESSAKDSFYKAAFEEYQTRYKSDKAAGALGMGILYAQGWGVEKSLEKALSYFTEAAYNQNPVALTVLGYFHHSGKNTQPDRVQAIEYYQHALDHFQDNTACALLAEILLLSPQNSDDQIKGQHYLEQALAHNVPYASLIQAHHLYQQLLKYPQDFTVQTQHETLNQALKWLEKAARQGLNQTDVFKNTLQQALENVSPAS